MKPVCEKCGNELTIRKGRYGKFWACPNYPDCKYTLDILEWLTNMFGEINGKLEQLREELGIEWRDGAEGLSREVGSDDADDDAPPFDDLPPDDGDPPL